MAVNNALNISQAGMVAHDGSGVFYGRTLTAGSGISIANGDGVSGNPTITATGSGGGGIIQQVRAQSTTAVSTTKQIATTGTTPTTANMDVLISATITPTDADNILIFDFQSPISINTADNTTIICALFEGSTFRSAWLWETSGNSPNASSPVIHYYRTAGTTSSTTFSIYFASASAVTTRSLQSKAGTYFLGGAGNTITQFIITEVQA